MKYNSELPLNYLKHNDINDYDFVLYHLLDNPEYYNYFKSSDRFKILDNSAWEFSKRGEVLDETKFIECIEDLNPDYYIVPDVLESFPLTVTNAREWYYKPIKSKAKRMAVVQGRSIFDLYECLLTYRRFGYKAVAIPFDLSCFEVEEGNIKSRSQGRIQFCKDASFILKEFEYIHLLGSHDWRETTEYPYYISSIDSSYPVKCAIKDVDMDGDKPFIFIDDFFNMEYDDKMADRIINNVLRFKGEK